LSKKAKITGRFLKMPKDFHFSEMVKLLSYYDYKPVKKGKTSGSRIKFENSLGISILLHKPSKWNYENISIKANQRKTGVMKNLNYKGYLGSIEYSEEDNLLYGKVLGIQSLLSYEGLTGKALENDFKEVINEYLENCKSSGNSPEKPFKGSFNVRISSSLHQKAALLAKEAKISLNNFVAESIRSKVMQEAK